MKNKLTKKERTFIESVEDKKDIIAYENVKMYAKTDIPIDDKRVMDDGILTPSEIWKGYNPTAEFLDEVKISEENNVTRHTFCAAHRTDGDLTVDIKVFAPRFDSPKTVLLVGDNNALPQSGIIKALTDSGCYVAYADYNAIAPDTLTTFPSSLSYGRKGCENEHLNTVCPTPKDTCNYLYTLITRRCVTFLNEVYHKTEIAVVGIRYGTEIAMQTAGTEPKRIIAVGCICGSGYPEYMNIPKITDDEAVLDDNTIKWLAGVSGVAYMRDYRNPVIIALGSNGTYSDVDRLSNLKSLVKGDFSVTITPQFSDNIDAESFANFSMRLNGVFLGSVFPSAPVTTIDINADGTVYADVSANKPMSIKQAVLYYSYNNANHKTRFWHSAVCETIGVAQYLAKLEFDKPCVKLFYYTKIVYVNGVSVTETPKYLNTADYRIKLVPQKSNAILFQHGAENKFCELSDDAVIMESGILEASVPVGIKGVVCHSGKMLLFVGENCRNVEQNKILQIDSYSAAKNYMLEIAVTSGGAQTAIYRASRYISSTTTFVGTRFACSDFKDEHFVALTDWKDVSSIAVLTHDVIVNKLMFI